MASSRRTKVQYSQRRPAHDPSVAPSLAAYHRVWERMRHFTSISQPINTEYKTWIFAEHKLSDHTAAIVSSDGFDRTTNECRKSARSVTNSYQHSGQTKPHDCRKWWESTTELLSPYRIQ